MPKFFRTALICGVVAFVLSACALVTKDISPERIASADYGPPPPDNYREIVETTIARQLIDPRSAIFEIGEPTKGYTKEGAMFGTHEAFGWRVCGLVNSKNRFGGYVGSVPFFTLFRANQIDTLIIGKITDNQYGINITNSSINEACSR